MDAVDYALENFDFIDKDRLGVTGGSYGGFMTNWIIGHTSRFKAAVTQRSISKPYSSASKGSRLLILYTAKHKPPQVNRYGNSSNLTR